MGYYIDQDHYTDCVAVLGVKTKSYKYEPKQNLLFFTFLTFELFAYICDETLRIKI